VVARLDGVVAVLEAVMAGFEPGVVTASDAASQGDLFDSS
jgi:hypothetical protein